VTYGTRWAQYDYLQHRILVSPRVEVTLAPAARTRVRASASRREQAPGAEEFLPPSDTGIWLPPQRTFSALNPGHPLEAERSTHVAVGVERDAGMATLSIRGFHERVEGQLVTLFGADLPGQPTATLGHYFVGSAGDATTTGCTAEVRAAWSSRVQGSVAYSVARAELATPDDPVNLRLLVPSAIRPAADHLHDVSTAIEANVPETSTRVLVLFRVGNAFARQPASVTEDDTGGRLDSRFDVQVRQSLPFLNFTSARWEMLLAVRNFFRDAASEQTVFDELLVLRPPKRIVGGVTMHF
jgi:outer membrane receptor protein involved in Fe transport